ncbi:hypothetical protein DOE73_20680 [Paenibacillus dendritiformis]|nr:hypothetical protein DOE73_20680 [Paenibacillus dendritiformis]
MHAGGKATLLHHIFQRQGILPSEILKLPEGERLFCLVSTKVALEAEAEERKQAALLAKQGKKG